MIRRWSYFAAAQSSIFHLLEPDAGTGPLGSDVGKIQMRSDEWASTSSSKQG